jgi:type III pantothenate kinase
VILELDAGNSRIKWRLLADGGVHNEGSVPGPDALAEVLRSLTPPRCVRMSSVRGEDANSAISAAIRAIWGLPVTLAKVESTCAGVRNQYQDPTRLGIDRWLAMLAAYHRAPGGCVVVDSGTALTIDVVDGEGLHQGGYITPGLSLMRESLVANTRIRLAADPVIPSLAPGHGTDAAVNNGTLAMQVALIDRVLAAARLSLPGIRLYLTGGDAPLLARLVAATDAEVVPGLVMDGLALACPVPAGDSA